MAVQKEKKLPFISVQSRTIYFRSHSIWDRNNPVRCHRVLLKNFDMKFVVFF